VSVPVYAVFQIASTTYRSVITEFEADFWIYQYVS